jgi:hypothetical protein
MKPAVFEIDRTKRGGMALYELLKNSTYAKLIIQREVREREHKYTFDDLNESSKNAFADADAGRTYKCKDTKDLFEQLGI